MVKFILAYLMTGLFTVLLVISDQGWISIASIVASFFTFAGVVFVAIRQGKMAAKVDGLLEEKTAASIALGTLKGIEDAKAEEAIRNKVRVEMMREQELKNQQPPGSKSESNVSGVKESIENEIKKQGDKIQEAVKEKGDEIKSEVPIVTADKVVDKLNPPK